ncbi:carboxypeptidase-like regulatory domain-containing protein [Niabella ginsengisoli]|uniref:Carboxypeptidase-like regulatory domain-containing protein n=1 Tax=Niabella ginsengisoli TaxID=522298 RepID=A0ABS9SLW4_9BACT|nr:carboxypeptidase-like regulatory domain-containing protein [Niabella ginsengisoli]MCH5599378.1 carboxypeptidase-like regulatory domain-containing protein [Niabella ginsengisoli]
MKKIVLFLVTLLFIGIAANAQFEKARDSVVQLFGIIMTADSLEAIPSVSVSVRGTRRGTITNNDGVFSIAVLKGDVIEFSHVSYQPGIIKVPDTLKGTQYSIVKTLVQDTTYLPVAIIRPRPTPEQFARDFINTPVAEDELEILRKSNTPEARRAYLAKLPHDGREMTNRQLNQVFQKARYQGQVPPMNIFSPAAWAEFINAWKRGDFKRK